MAGSENSKPTRTPKQRLAAAASNASPKRTTRPRKTVGSAKKTAATESTAKPGATTPKRKRAPRRRAGVSYSVEYAEERRPWTVPVWWVNTVFGLFLLVPLGIWFQTFFNSLSQETMKNAFWATEQFWFFNIGIVMWLIVFFAMPRPIVIYVFGHEATHALWAMAMGGRVSEFEVGREGGYIVTDTHNFWIALAPYFFPIYTLAAIGLYSGLGLFLEVEPYARWYYGCLGMTWAFHVCFTLWMIPKGQTDLTYHGTFFSLVIIGLMNLLVLTIFLIAASAGVTWLSFGTELLRNTMDFSEWCVIVARSIAASL